MRIYQGSDGEATKAMYARLEQRAPAGIIAMNLFRAQKCSERAKVYRGGGFRDKAYGRKQWSLDLLCAALLEYSERLQIGWGWGEDPKQVFHRWVLYVELPNGQVSFHTEKRGVGPNAPREWDGRRGASPSRICCFVATVLDGRAEWQPTGDMFEAG
jgi:hypothetical protein